MAANPPVEQDRGHAGGEHGSDQAGAESDEGELPHGGEPPVNVGHWQRDPCVGDRAGRDPDGGVHGLDAGRVTLPHERALARPQRLLHLLAARVIVERREAALDEGRIAHDGAVGGDERDARVQDPAEGVGPGVGVGQRGLLGEHVGGQPRLAQQAVPDLLVERGAQRPLHERRRDGQRQRGREEHPEERARAERHATPGDRSSSR